MNSPADQISILIVDDHVLVREGLRGILESQDDMCVVGEAGDSGTTVVMTAEKLPNIVLLDIEIPGGEVTTTVREIRRCSPRSRVIILSMYEGPQLVQDALAAGIRGYLLKNIHWQELVVAIRTVHADADRVILGVSHESLRQLHSKHSAGMLSARESEILDLVRQAFSNAQIASQLGLTEATVKRHLRKIFVKLGAVSRIDAVNKWADLQPHSSRLPSQGTGAAQNRSRRRADRPEGYIRRPALDGS
jgi:DNA-binding NarL/FixJ family response regulator